MFQSLKLLFLYSGFFDTGFAERRFANRVISIRGSGPSTAAHLGAFSTTSSLSQLRIDSKLHKGKKKEPEENADVEITPHDEGNDPKAEDAGSSKESASGTSIFKGLNWTYVYIALGCLGFLILGICLYFCIGRKKSEEADTKEAEVDDETIALSDTLLRELVSRSLQRVGPALAKGQALQNTVERAIATLSAKAQQLLMSELNCTAGSICQTLDAEEAMLILDWDAAVKANFPAITVLLAGLLAPTMLQINLYGHLAIAFLLLVPVALLCAWAAWQDYGIPCPAIPTLFMWLYVQGALALVLCLVRLLLVWQIRSGQAKLQQKAAEFQEKRSGKGKRVIGTLGELQEIFVSHSVLVQHALLIEESVANSALNKLVGIGTFVWIVVTLWGTVLVLGWTFVPGMVAFHHDAAKAAGSHFCGAWATVFVARLVVIIGILFFLVNSLSALSWASNLALGAPWVQGKARHWARTFDMRFQGLPVMQVLFKAFVLPRELDTTAAELAAQLHEQTLMEQEQAECEQKLKEIREQLEAQRKKTSKLTASATSQSAKDKLEDKLAMLEKRSRAAMDAGEWKQQGSDAIDAARANALAVEQASTQELERVFNRIREAADQLQNSEATKEMLQKAQQAADQLGQQAQQATQVGKEKLKEFSESEQGQQVRAAVSAAGSSAAAAAERSAAVAKEKAAKALEKTK